MKQAWNFDLILLDIPSSLIWPRPVIEENTARVVTAC